MIAGVVRTPIARASSNDLMTMAVGEDAASMQVGVVLMLDRRLDTAAVRRALAERVRAVPRLRQRLVSTPWGCGRPVWVDDADFDIDNTSAPGAALRRVTSPRCWTWRLRPSRTRFRSIAHCGRERWLPTSRMTGARSCSSCITSSLMASEAWRHLPSSPTERQLRWARHSRCHHRRAWTCVPTLQGAGTRPSSGSGRRAAGA